MVIGLTGSFGSGCSTVTDVLRERFGFKRFSMSSPIRDQWQRENTEGDRTAAPRVELQRIGNSGRESNGLDHWAVQVGNLIEDNDDRVVIDSIRSLAEVEYFRTRFPNFFLIAVLTPRAERWERVRGEYERQGLGEPDFITDDERDQIEEVEYGQQVVRCVDEADLVISNARHEPSEAAAKGALAEPLQMYVGLLSGDAPIAPAPGEIAMTMAYAQSRRSFCLKRHVGAVIADREGEVIATGFNENPGTMAPCYVEFKYCYKDAQMTGSLRHTECPGCKTNLGEVFEPYRCACGYDLKLRFFPDRGMRWCTALHAEERALLNTTGRDTAGGVIYTTTFPCFHCARQIAQSGIKTVVYVDPYPQLDVLPFLERNGIKTVPFQGVKARAFERVFARVQPAMEKKFRLGGSA